MCGKSRQGVVWGGCFGLETTKAVALPTGFSGRSTDHWFWMIQGDASGVMRVFVVQCRGSSGGRQRQHSDGVGGIGHASWPSTQAGVAEKG